MIPNENVLRGAAKEVVVDTLGQARAVSRLGKKRQAPESSSSEALVASHFSSKPLMLDNSRVEPTQSTAPVSMVSMFPAASASSSSLAASAPRPLPGTGKPWTTRKLRSECGVEMLRKAGLRYEECERLHGMWMQYILSTVMTDRPSLVVMASRMYRADLHGAKLSVVMAGSPCLVGIEGIVLQDWHNVFRLITPGNKIKTIPKRGSLFQISLGSHTCHIVGSSFCIRPAQRSKR